jgi:hypothetical protein
LIPPVWFLTNFTNPTLLYWDDKRQGIVLLASNIFKIKILESHWSTDIGHPIYTDIRIRSLLATYGVLYSYEPKCITLSKARPGTSAPNRQNASLGTSSTVKCRPNRVRIKTVLSDSVESITINMNCGTLVCSAAGWRCCKKLDNVSDADV